MGKESNQPIFQIRYTNDHQAHDKMLNITNNQENANQNHSEILPHTCYDAYYQVDRRKQMLLRMWRKGKSCIMLVGM